MGWASDGLSADHQDGRGRRPQDGRGRRPQDGEATSPRGNHAPPCTGHQGIDVRVCRGVGLVVERATQVVQGRFIGASPLGQSRSDRELR
ncbi:MAG: hypothetical protein ACYDC9_13515, partial [Dermatophilaceae bacterium]